jgi:hypothetical protein
MLSLRERNSARHVGEIITPRGWHDAVFLVIQGYVDGSNLHSGADIVAVCGVASRKEAWPAWEDKWKELLAFSGLHRWHHTDFMAKVKRAPGQPDRNWGDAEWLLARRMLCDSFEVTESTFLGATIPRKDYEDVRGRFPSLPEDPYYFLLDRCMHRLIQGMFQVEPKDDGVAVYCDQDKDEALVRQLAQWHADYLHGAPRHHYPEDATRPVVTAYGSCLEYVPLQAADVIAHEIMRFARSNPDMHFIASNRDTGSFILERLKKSGVMLVLCLDKTILEMEMDGRAFVPGYPHGYRFVPPVRDPE